MTHVAATKSSPTSRSYSTQYRYEPGPDLAAIRGGAVLERGHSGEGVRSIQALLNAAGANPPLAEDGLFGPKTKAALREFQQRNGIEPRGVLDAATLEALERAAANPAAQQERDDFGRSRRPAPRAPHRDERRPEGSVRAGDLARDAEQRRRSSGTNAPVGTEQRSPRDPASNAPVGNVAPAVGNGTPADNRLAEIQNRTMGSARRELDAGVREHGGPNRGDRVDQYARNARMPVGGEWCGYFTQFNYAEAAREAGGRWEGGLHSFQKARSFFAYRSYTDNSRGTNERLDQLQQTHRQQGSERRFMVLEGSSGQQWAERHNRPHEVFNPATLPIRAGDTALWNRGHVGLVEGYDQRTGILTTVEGNTTGGAVRRRTYDLNDPAVRRQFEGFGRPALGDFGVQ